MAYTRTWDNATPTGAEAANTIDDIIRDIKEDIDERMNDLTAGSTPGAGDGWTQDPVSLQLVQVDALMHFGPDNWVGARDDDDIVRASEGFLADNNLFTTGGGGIDPTGQYTLPLRLPVGADIQQIFVSIQLTGYSIEGTVESHTNTNELTIQVIARRINNNGITALGTQKVHTATGFTKLTVYDEAVDGSLIISDTSVLAIRVRNTGVFGKYMLFSAEVVANISGVQAMV